MKDAIKEIVGKTISGVVVKESHREPKTQVFLIFTDNTYYELYSASGDISGTGGIDAGGIEAVRSYGSSRNWIELEAFMPESSTE